MTNEILCDDCKIHWACFYYLIGSDAWALCEVCDIYFDEESPTVVKEISREQYYKLVILR